jgi:hypothetical protein
MVSPGLSMLKDKDINNSPMTSCEIIYDNIEDDSNHISSNLSY